jgi:hypothetical protein
MSEHPGSPNKIELMIVVNGTPYPVEANVNAPLHTVINKALADSKNSGQAPENWQLKLEDGTSLDPEKKVSTYGFAAGATLFLSLRAGAGG